MRSATCSREAEAPNSACPECMKLLGSHSVARTISRFSMKHLFARLLSARLFQGAAAAEEVEKEIRESQTYKRDQTRTEEIIALKPGQLQQYVRANWLSHPQSSCTDAYTTFVSTVVKPCLDFNTSSVPANFADILARLSAVIASGQGGEAEIASLKVARGALNGKLHAHPLIHGLTLQCLRKIDKEQKGITTMSGRRGNESEHEALLIANAGLSLAICGGNKQLAKEHLVSNIRKP